MQVPRPPEKQPLLAEGATVFKESKMNEMEARARLKLAHVGSDSESKTFNPTLPSYTLERYRHFD